MARLRLFGLLALFLAVVWGFGDKVGSGPRRPPLVREMAPPPAAEPRYWEGDVYTIAPGRPCPKLCSGSAFAIDDRGHWLTAHHVVDSCRAVMLRTEAGERLAVLKISSHPGADLSLLTTKATAPALPLNLSTLRTRQSGFLFGFPASRPGEVYGQLLGAARARHPGPGGGDEPILAWAELGRNPPREGSLGGLSGGAVLDETGAVVGVTTAESPRRGRVLSAAPSSLRELLQASGLGPLARAGERRGPAIDADDYPEVGRSLRRQRTVAMVLCRA